MATQTILSSQVQDLNTTIAAAITTHNAASDPHPGYMTAAEDAAIMAAHAAAVDPHPGYMTAAEVAAALTNLPAAYAGATKNTFLAENASNAINDVAYTKKLEYRMPIGGQILTRMVLSGTPGSVQIYCRVYVNGVASGTERFASTTNTAFEELITVAAGDLLQVYAYITTGVACFVSFSLWTGTTSNFLLPSLCVVSA